MAGENQSIISNVVWKFAERILAQGTSILVSIILARLLLPEDYGAISMVTIFISIADIFVTNGIPNALIQKKDAEKEDFSSVFYFNLVLSFILYIVMFLTAPLISKFYNSEVLTSVIRVMGLRIIIAAVNSVQHAYVSRHMMFRKYFFSTLYGTAISGGIGIWMAYKGYGIWALVAQYMTNTVIDTIVLFFIVDWRPTYDFSFNRIKKLLNFGWKILVEGLSSTMEVQFKNLVIGKVYSPSDLAYYTKSQQFPSALIGSVSAAINSVLFPAMSSSQDNKKEVLFLLRKAIRVFSFVAYPMLMGFALIAKTFVVLVLTDKWLPMVPYLQVFCLLEASAVGLIPRHQALNGTGRSDVFMYEHIAARIMNIVLLLSVYRISVLAVMFSSVVGSVIMIVMTAFTSKKYNGYAYSDQIKDVVPVIIGCLVMSVPVRLVQFIPVSDIAILILQVLVGGFAYLLFSFVFQLEGFVILRAYFVSLIEVKKTKKCKNYN